MEKRKIKDLFRGKDLFFKSIYRFHLTQFNPKKNYRRSCTLVKDAIKR